MKTKTIIKALEIIHNYCENEDLNCKDCVFYTTNFCDKISPNQWDIADIKEQLKDIERID